MYTRAYVYSPFTENCQKTTVPKQIAFLVKTKSINSHHPDYMNFSTVLKNLLQMMKITRDEGMESMEGYAGVLKNVGHTFKIFSLHDCRWKSSDAEQEISVSIKAKMMVSLKYLIFLILISSIHMT